MKRVIVATMGLIAGAALTACQTNNPDDYVQISPGPAFAYSHARCEIASSSVDQGYLAVGSADFVIGASLGNAIGNAARRDQFMKNCLIMHGWQRAPRGQARPPVHPTLQTHPHKQGLPFPPAPT